MELIVLGAGPAYTDRRGSLGASYLARSEGAALLLDLGQGAFPSLASTMEPSNLTAVLVSHLHPDHFIDLVPLRHYLTWEFHPPRRVAVLGPADLTARLDGVDGVDGFAATALDIEHLEEGTRRIGPFDVEARRVSHHGESYAFRVLTAGTSGPGFVYSGDCGDANDLIPLIHRGDTLLSEASFGAGTVPAGAGHLTSVDAAHAATAGGAARLLLTHIQMGYSRAEALGAAESAFGGPIQFVTEGDRFEV